MAASDIESLTKEASEFMETVSDDLLLEILLRLPNSRAAIQSATVCKRWYSLVTTPHFPKSFIEYHRNKRHSDFSILFKCSSSHRVPYYKLSLKESENVTEPYDLSFIPRSAGLEIKATCGDLLLVGRVRGSVLNAVLQYYVCDSLTLQWFALPELPTALDYRFDFQGAFGYTLACHPKDRARFRVAMIYESCFNEGRFTLWGAFYDSDTAEWAFGSFDIPYDMPDVLYFRDIPLEIVPTGRGTLHWHDGMYVASFDPFGSEVRLIRLPAAEFNGINLLSVKDGVRLGVVRDRLRLSRMRKINDCGVGLRIWEVESDGDSWRLVYDVIMETSPGVELGGIWFFVLAFDPSDGGTIFLVRDKAICRYEIEQDVYEMVCEFPISCVGRSKRRMKAGVAKHLKALTLVSPLWPTPTPSLGCARD